MEMTFVNIQDVITDVEVHRGNGRHWIFEDGKLRDGIYTCDILKFLRNNSDNAIPVDSEVFENIQGMSYNFDKFEPHNNYNQNGNSSEVIEYHTFEDAWDFYVAISVHIGMDVRVDYTDFVLFRFDSFEDFWDALDQKYTLEAEDFNAEISVNALCEDIDVYACFWNYNKNEEEYISFECYDIEKEDIVDSIRNKICEEINNA